MAARIAAMLAMLVFVFCLGTNSASAALLNLQSGLPDLASAFITIEYDAGTDTFHANGIVMNLDLVGGPSPDFDFPADWFNPGSGEISATFDIDVRIDGTGALAGGQGLRVIGSIPDLGYVNEELLTGKLVDFGYQDGPNPGNGPRRFELRFDEIGGKLKPYFDKVGSVGVILNSGNIDFQGHFNSDFDNLLTDGWLNTTADTYGEVPEPMTLTMWSLMATSLVALRRRRSRSMLSKTDRAESAANHFGS